jgi:hypothetical protein
VVQNVQIAGCGLDGLALGAGGSVLDCNAASSGRDGVSVQGASLVAGCNARNNTRYGILAADSCAVENSTARENGNSGVRAGQACALVEVSTRANRGAGLELGAGGLVSDCDAFENSSNGVVALAAGVKVQRVLAFHNGGYGILGTNATMVQDCTLRLNTNAGLRVNSFSFALNNIAERNIAGPGFSVAGSASRIENNHAFNVGGFNISGSNNVIVQNTAYQNSATNYVISPTNNFYQVIINPFSESSKLDEPWGSYDLF